MAHKIDTAAARTNLPNRREPYWHALGRGKHIGYRKHAKGATIGTWIARLDGATYPLGDLADVHEGKRFNAACDAAQARFVEVAALAPGARGNDLTIAQACDAHILAVADRIREQLGADAADRAARSMRQRVAFLVTDRPAFAAAAIRTLTQDDFLAWRRHIAAKPTASRSNRGAQRSQATINKDLTVLRAALNRAYKKQQVGNKTAWQEPLQPIAHADTGRARKLYLNPTQRAAFAAAGDNEDVRAFIGAIAILPFRPGVVAALTVADYDIERSTVHLGWDKKHPPRSVILPPDAARLFAAQCKGKTPGAPLFARPSGEFWNSDVWKQPVKHAVLKAGLKSGNVLYTLRHSVITDLLQAGVDQVSVAKYAGTSVLMIERNYHHILDGQSQRDLAVLQLPPMPAASVVSIDAARSASM